MFQTEMKFEIIWKPEIGGVQLQLWVSLVPNVGCHFLPFRTLGEVMTMRSESGL